MTWPVGSELLSSDFRMKRILFPMTQPSPSPPPSETQTDERNTDRSVTWLGVTPLEMVERVVTLFERSQPLSHRRSTNPLSIDTSFLSTPTTELPPLPPAIRRQSHPPPDDKPLRITILQHAPDEEEPIPRPPKRSRPSWDFGCVARLDPAAKQPISKLSSLAAQLEMRGSYEDCLPSYKRVKYDFATRADRIHRQVASDDRRVRLDGLYEDTGKRMEALLRMADDMDSEDQHNASTPDAVESCPAKEAKLQPLANKTRVPKKNFLRFMNDWLKANWTNPFPDDDVLEELAAACGTSSNVVKTWLINNRTRKWRPAIVKAYNLGRPADLLMEDAIRIFEGKPVREVEGVVFEDEVKLYTKGKVGK